MLQYLLKNADFAGLFRFASPNFFKVVSPAALLQIAGVLAKNKGNGEGWEKARGGIFRAIREARFSGSCEPGEQALRIFFLQIFTQSVWVLDFRREAFADFRNPPKRPTEKIPVGWEPRPYYYEISPNFLRGLRSLYRGFYEEDPALFRAALGDLGLEQAEAALREHLGAGDQTKVEFRLKHFQGTFTKVFEVCHQKGIALHSDFFVLGLMLLGLYENLEEEGQPQNVRRAFLAASKAAKSAGDIS